MEQKTFSLPEFLKKIPECKKEYILGYAQAILDIHLNMNSKNPPQDGENSGFESKARSD